MNQRANLRVRISADLADIKQGLGLLRGDLSKLKRDAARAMPNLGSNAAVAGVRRLRNEVGGLVAAYASLRGARMLGGIADEAALIRGRVREARGDYEALLALANETRSGLEGTVDLYARMERSTREHNIGQERLLKVTRAVNQAIKLSYADASAGDAAVMQLGQALASGVLRGEELNSVMEQTPRLAEAIANGMGKPLGALRALAKEGKVTSEAVINALEDQAGVLEKEFSQVPVTIKDAMTEVRNAFVDYIGDVDAAEGTSRKFAETLQQVARDLPKYLDPVLQVVRLLLQNLDALAVFMVTRFVAAAIPAMIVGVTRLIATLKAATTATVTLRTALMLLGGPVGLAVAALTAGLYLLYKRTRDAKQAADEHREAMKANKDMAYQSRDAARADAEAKRKQAAETLKAARAALAQKQIELGRAVERTRGVTGVGQAGMADQAVFAASNATQRARADVQAAQEYYEEWGRRLVELALDLNDEILEGSDAVATGTEESNERIIGSNALLRDSIARTLAELERMYADNEIGISEYFQARRRLQEQAIDAEIQQLRMQAAGEEGGQRRQKIEEDITKLLRDRAEIAVATARDEKKAQEELAASMDQFYIARLENEGKVARAVRARLEGEHRDQIARLQAEGREEDVRTIRLHIDAEVAKAQLSQFENQMTATLARLQATEQSLSAQQQAGLLGVIESERQIKDARTEAMQQLQELRAEAVAFLATLSADSPQAQKVLEFLSRLDGDTAIVASSMQRFRQQVADSAIDSVSNFFMDLVDGSKSAGEALRDFVRNFALGMAQIAARALATYLVLQMLDAIYPGLGKATAAGMSVGQNHTGGLAGAVGGIRRWVHPAIFDGAARYHGGGIAGLEPDEVPAILQRGEEVLTRNDPRHRDNMRGEDGGRDAIVKQPIVAIGDRAVADALASAAGEEVVLTHVRNNWGALSSGG